VQTEEAIRTRRTHKAYTKEPLDRQTLDELFELARWAPNHNLTNPWRFRVVGPEALERLKAAAGPESAPKLDRAPTLVVASAIQLGDDPIRDDEDLNDAGDAPMRDAEALTAAAAAPYILLLAAPAKALAGSWRTPEVLRTPEGRAAVGVPADEKVLGLVYLGHPCQDRAPPDRAPAEEYVTYLP